MGLLGVVVVVVGWVYFQFGLILTGFGGLADCEFLLLLPKRKVHEKKPH